MRNLRKFFIALACAATAALLAFGAVGCSKSIPQWIKEQQCGEHEWNNGEVTKVASCAEEGEMTYTCTECGKVDVQVLAKLPHTELVVEKIDASCNKVGYTEGTICTACETWIVERQVIPKKEHTVIVEKAVAATCLLSGSTRGSYCEVCEEVFEAKEIIPALGHNLVTLEGYAATCTKEGLTKGVICDRCNTTYNAQEIIPTLEHKFVDDYCLDCGAIDHSAFAEVGIINGENIRGNWYRIYAADDNGNIAKINFFNWAPAWLASINGEAALRGSDNFTVITTSGIEIMEYGDYFDIYFAEDFSFELEYYDGSILHKEANEDTTILTSNLYGKVYRLVVPLITEEAIETATFSAVNVGDRAEGFYRLKTDEILSIELFNLDFNLDGKTVTFDDGVFTFTTPSFHYEGMLGDTYIKNSMPGSGIEGIFSNDSFDVAGWEATLPQLNALGDVFEYSLLNGYMYFYIPSSLTCEVTIRLFNSVTEETVIYTVNVSAENAVWNILPLNVNLEKVTF